MGSDSVRSEEPRELSRSLREALGVRAQRSVALGPAARGSNHGRCDVLGEFLPPVFGKGGGSLEKEGGRGRELPSRERSEPLVDRECDGSAPGAGAQSIHLRHERVEISAQMCSRSALFRAKASLRLSSRSVIFSEGFEAELDVTSATSVRAS